MLVILLHVFFMSCWCNCNLGTSNTRVECISIWVVCGRVEYHAVDGSRLGCMGDILLLSTMQLLPETFNTMKQKILPMLVFII